MAELQEATLSAEVPEVVICDVLNVAFCMVKRTT